MKLLRIHATWRLRVAAACLLAGGFLLGLAFVGRATHLSGGVTQAAPYGGQVADERRTDLFPAATGIGFHVWAGNAGALAYMTDADMRDLLDTIVSNGGDAVYVPVYQPSPSPGPIVASFLFSGTLPWAGTPVSTDPRYPYSLATLVQTAHAPERDLKVYAVINCFSTGGWPERYIVPDAPTDRRLWEHLAAVAKYLLSYGVDGIVLDFIRYPSISEGSTPPGDARARNIAAFVRFMADQISGARLLLTTWAPTDETATVRGQDLAQLAAAGPLAILPQLYASNGFPNYTGDPTLAALRGYAERAGREIGDRSLFIPLLQAYDTFGEDSLCQPGGVGLQAAIRAVFEASPQVDNIAAFGAHTLMSEADTRCAPPGEWLQLAVHTLRPPRSRLEAAITGFLSGGVPVSVAIDHPARSDLQLTIAWRARVAAGLAASAESPAPGRLAVMVTAPQGAIFGPYEVRAPTEAVLIPGADVGRWWIELTGLDAPGFDYAVAAYAAPRMAWLPLFLHLGDAIDPTPTPTATSTPAPMPTPTVTPRPTVCYEAITNGGFETNAAWLIPTTAYSARYSTARAHSGARALLAGIANPAENVYSFATARQPVTLPADTVRARLRFWYYPLSTEPTVTRALPYVTLFSEEILANDDVQYLLVLNASSAWLGTLLWERSDARVWLQREFDLAPYAGQTIQPQFGVRNDGAGGVTAMYVDDVSLEVCRDQAP